jgi:hypothetical protein
MAAALAAVLVLPAIAHADPAATPAWQKWVDLDGNGTPEDVRVFLPSAAAKQAVVDPDVDLLCGVRPCHVRIEVGTQALELDVSGGLGVRVIQIDQATKRRELLITQVGGEDGEEDPPHVYSVVTYAGGKLQRQTLWSGGDSTKSEAIADGKGSLVVRYDGCPTRTTVTYRRKGDQIVEIKHDERRTRRQEDCSG